MTDAPAMDLEEFSDIARTVEAKMSQLYRGYVPLGIRDIVRDYFTSLAPRSSGDDE